MDELVIDELVKQYPYLNNYIQHMLITTEEDFTQLKESDQIFVDGEKVSAEFIKRILQNDTYYDYAYRFFTNQVSEFSVVYLMSGDIGAKISYAKPQIVHAIEDLIDTGKADFNTQQLDRFKQLKDSIDFDKFEDSIKGQLFDIKIDGNEYSLPIEKLVSVMKMSDDEFDKLCDNASSTSIDGVPTNHFIYAAFKYFKDGQILRDYLVPPIVDKRFWDIGSLKKIDLQALNKYLTTKDSMFKRVSISKELEDCILSSMPSDLTELEKAAYIYIKMCKVLTYDDEYYAVNQVGAATMKHKRVDYVANVTPENNKVVCFEFNLIYSKFLDSLGIKFKSDYKNMIDEAYGEGHANLEFRSGKYLVSADSVVSILNGDIVRAKLNEPLVGLRCVNRNDNTREEFNGVVSNIYHLIIEQDKQSRVDSSLQPIQTVDDLVNAYVNATSNLHYIALEDKVSILIEKLNSTGMLGIDYLSYILQLRKTLFNEEEREKNVKVSIIRNNDAISSSQVAMASAIFTVNDNDVTQNREENIYYFFNPGYELQQISREQLQEKFDSLVFEYVGADDPRIPGIVESRGAKK